MGCLRPVGSYEQFVGSLIPLFTHRKNHMRFVDDGRVYLPEPVEELLSFGVVIGTYGCNNINLFTGAGCRTHQLIELVAFCLESDMRKEQMLIKVAGGYLVFGIWVVQKRFPFFNQLHICGRNCLQFSLLLG